MVVSQEQVTALADLDGVAAWAGVTTTTIRRWVRDGKFPKPLSLARPRWDMAELRAWAAKKESAAK